MQTIRISVADWAGDYTADNGHDAIRLFFRDILAGKIKLCQLSPIGIWIRPEDGEEIPFRIAPALMLAGKMTLDEVVATLRAIDLAFSRNEIKRMAQADSWMLE